jgi:hypothetical protein
VTDALSAEHSPLLAYRDPVLQIHPCLIVCHFCLNELRGCCVYS